VRKIKEMLRLHFEVGLTNRQIARSLSVSHSTVNDLLGRFQVAGLDWPLPEDLDEAALEAELYSGNTGKSRRRPEPDWNQIHRELSRKGVTLQLLWFEYKEQYPDGYQYSQFCERYRLWSGKLDVVMRQDHRAGEKVFVDFAGQKVPVTDPRTGRVTDVPVFVATLGASSYTYVEATAAEDLRSFIGAHCRAFEFFGGIPEVVVPDNLKAGVTHPCRYEPDLNPTYLDMAAFYGTVVIPARSARPRDKAKVESAVGVVERRVLAPLRDRTFFSLAELNQALGELADQLNRRPFQKLDGSRRSLFEELDRPALRPLPGRRYEFTEWKKARVNIDYHVEVDHNYYSVPYALVHKEVEVRLTLGTVEVLFRGHRVASHVRAHGRGRFVTDPAHMPEAHRHQRDRTPARLIAEAEAIGPEAGKLVQAILLDRPHPEQGYRACLGVIRLGRRYPPERIEAAAQRANRSGVRSYKRFQSILENGLDRVPLEPRPETPPAAHPNVRGPHYFGKEATSC
jgi:transposase